MCKHGTRFMAPVLLVKPGSIHGPIPHFHQHQPPQPTSCPLLQCTLDQRAHHRWSAKRTVSPPATTLSVSPPLSSLCPPPLSFLAPSMWNSKRPFLFIFSAAARMRVCGLHLGASPCVFAVCHGSISTLIPFRGGVVSLPPPPPSPRAAIAL